MPYRRKRRYNRRRKSVCKPTYGNMTKKLWSDVKYLKSLINTEFKTNDQAFAAVASPAGGATTLLNGLAQGDDLDDRSGRVVRWKSLQMKGVTNLNASATQSVARYLIVIDKQPSAVLPTITQILNTSDMVSFRNLDNRKRFIILKDFRQTVNTDFPEKTWKFYMKLDMKTIYDASNAGTIADISSNAILFFRIGDEATNSPTSTFTTRMRFIDN